MYVVAYAVAPRALRCDVLGSPSFIRFQIDDIIHDSHVLVAKTRDVEKAKSFSPCGRPFSCGGFLLQELSVLVPFMPALAGTVEIILWLVY